MSGSPEGGETPPGAWESIERGELERRLLEAAQLLLATQEALARVSGAHQRVLRELEIRRQEHDVLRRALDELEGTSSAEIALLREQLEGVLGSTSWQLTQPLRTIKARVREPGA